jgi:hypothetical protein
MAPLPARARSLPERGQNALFGVRSNPVRKLVYFIAFSVLVLSSHLDGHLSRSDA